MTEMVGAPAVNELSNEKLQRVLQAGTNLEQLINELCPDGVEYSPLGSICNNSRPKIDPSRVTPETYTGVENLLQNFGGRIDAERVPTTNVTQVLPGDVLLGNIRPYLRKAWLSDRPGAASGDVIVINIKPSFAEKIIPSFLYYILTSNVFYDLYCKTAKGGAMPRGDRSAILRFNIPVPPVEVQEEIVRILDLFTELEAELEKRRAQYAYYRDTLLSFNTLTEIDREREREPR